MGVGMTERLGFSLKLALFALLSTTLVSADAVYAAQAQQARAERPKLGLVLSGGGARGFAHIGALKALEELRVRFDVIAGTSMGSMVGGAYAAGYSAKQIENITLAVDWPRMFAPRPDRDRMDWQGKDNDRRGLGPTEIGVTGDGLRFSGQLVPSQELDIFLPVRQTIAGSYQYHVAYQIDPGTLFRHRMFHLQAGIHFQKIKILVFIHHELQRSGTVIINPLTGFHCNLQHLGTCFGIHKRRRRFFNYFLIASLNGTFPFIKMNYISIFISQYLHFNVMGILDIFFNINSIVAKRRSGFRL